MCGVQRGLAGLVRRGRENEVHVHVQYVPLLYVPPSPSHFQGPNDYLYVSSLLPKYGHMYKLGFKFVNGKTKTETNKTTEK